MAPSRADDGSVPARLARHLERQRAGTKGDDFNGEDLALEEVLEHFRVTKFSAALEEAGVETVADLAYLGDADLEKIGIPMIPRRKLLEAMGCDWRGAGGDAPAEPAPAAPTVNPMPPLVLRGTAGVGGLPRMDGGETAEMQAEVRLLCDNIGERIEDFAEANGLDADAYRLVQELPPVVALRVMGLLGRGNAFVMQGVRRPGAAVNSRSRAAQTEMQGGRGVLSHPPLQDWRRLCEDFCTANSLPDDIRETIKELPRDQALRVVGATSGLRFMVHGEKDEVELEVRSRINSAMSGEEMVPVIPRTPRPEYIPPETVRPQYPSHGGGGGGGGGFALNTFRGGGGGGGGGGRHQAAPLVHPRRERDRSRSHPRRSSRHVGGYDHRGGDELAPYWKQNLDDFIQVNDLDSRSSQALGELTKLQALHVMGLIGGDNSFVIRGVRNTSAAVMQRLAKAQFSQYDPAEPYQQLRRLLEDFVEINKIDERGLEVLRSLKDEALLHVLGITAENSFVISGVRNTSAALMARVAAAQKKFPPWQA